MSELVLMPTPNWFTSRPIAICQETGTIAFSAICSILLTDNLLDTYNSTIREAHAKRILCLAFYKGLPRSSDETLLASCSEDLDVKIWNSKTKALINQHKLHQNVPVSIDWLEMNDSNEPILISCDIKENKPISQLKTCPNSHLVAIGYKQGTIVILDVKNEQMKIVHKLKNHDDTINCLSWFPDKKINNEQEEVTELLKCKWNTSEISHILCSSSEDKTIRLWCVDRGEEVQCVKAPGPSGSRSSSDKRMSNIAFTPLCWPDSRYLVSGSFKGELSYYDLLSGSETQWLPFISPDKSHKKIIYEIASYKDKILTLSLDRLINVWDMVNFKQQSSMSTLNGYVYSVVSSPIDPNVMAVSVGDSSIKLLNEKLHKKITKNLTNNIKSEVTQIAWHPTKENILAFGTKEGKVGIIDTMTNNKNAQYIYSNFNQSVYTLVWSYPIINQSEPVTKIQDITNKSELAWRSSKPSKSSAYSLYSVADSKIIQHNMQFLGGGSAGMIVNSNYKSLNLYNKILEADLDDTNVNQSADAFSKSNLEYGLTEFSVLMPDKDQDEIYFIIGKFDGSMEIFKKCSTDSDETQKITKLCTFFNHQKLVTCSKWNKRKNLIASGSNDYSIVILDFESLLEEIKLKFEGQADLKFYAKFKHKLIGHKERITGISWSSFEEFNMLASCSYDGTIQIWNADKGTPLANYRGHSEKILCCMFSNTDLNTVFSGGEDYTLHKWRIDAQTNILPPEECSIVLKKKNRGAKKNQSKKPETETSWRQEKKNETEIDLTEIEDETNQQTEIKKEEEPIKKPAVKSSSQRELKSLLMLSSHGNKSQKSKIKDCLNLFEMLYEGKQDEIRDKMKNNSNDFEFNLRDFEIPTEQINLFAFGNRKSVIQMVDLEHAELKRLGSDKWYILDVWRGNLAKVFKEFYDQNQLNDIIFNLYQISVSSNPITLEFLTEYIDQLSKNSSSNNEKIHKAVLYSLASYDVHKALEIYVANNLYLYALTLAQLRLAPTDPYLNIILNKYGVFATMNGDYEMGVMCYMRSGDFENAYKVLIRRNVKNDVESEVLIKNLLEKMADLMPRNSGINII